MRPEQKKFIRNDKIFRREIEIRLKYLWKLSLIGEFDLVCRLDLTYIKSIVQQTAEVNH